jgi:hypothetical protein
MVVGLRLLSRRLALLLALLAVACSERAVETPTAPSRGELEALLTPEAAASLDDSGHLQLAVSQGPGEISGERAALLALAYIREFGVSIRSTLERERGESIAFAKLEVCGSALYAAGPFMPLASEAPMTYQRAFGSKWLVGLCGEKGDIQVSVAVSARANDVTISDGRLDFGRSDGNEFFSFGVPPGWESPVGLSPERAVQRIARKTGRRVSEVPVLIGVDPKVAYPQGAVWRVRLERPIRLRGVKSAQAALRDTVFAGLHEDLPKAPAGVANDVEILRTSEAAQPPERNLRYYYFDQSPSPSPSDEPTSATTVLRRRPDMPIAFERSTVEP